MKIKNSNLKASVLVANYNNSKFIDKCIKSIINQTYNNIEIIFIDDRSTDNSLKVAKKYSHKIKLISQKKKSGIGCYDQISTYYEGFKKSTGDIIFFLDSDDYFRKEKISILMNKFKNDAKIDILNDLPIKKFIKKTLFIKRKKKLLNSYWSYISPQSCISIRKTKMKKFFELADTKSFPDLWFDFRIGIISKYIFNQANFIDKNLTYYRQTYNNVSSNFGYLSLNWWQRRLQAHNFIKFFFKKNKIYYKKNFDYYLTNFINFFI